MGVVIVFVALLGVSSPSLADDTSKIMSELGTDLDIAEGSLRIILNIPGANGKYPNANCESKFAAAIALLNFETRHPGYLQGKHGTTTWPQYNAVRKLYDKLSEAYAFFDKRNEPNTSLKRKGVQ